MITFRGWRRIAAFIVLAAFGALVVAITATQTSWFKDWLRVYVTREAERYLDGTLQVARLEGNLFTGVRLEHVQLLQGGKEVLAADSVGLSYNVLTIVAHGLIVDDLSIAHPVIRARRDAAGWNLSHLVRERSVGSRSPGAGTARLASSDSHQRRPCEHRRQDHNQRLHGQAAAARRAH